MNANPRHGSMLTAALSAVVVALLVIGAAAALAVGRSTDLAEQSDTEQSDNGTSNQPDTGPTNTDRTDTQPPGTPGVGGSVVNTDEPDPHAAVPVTMSPSAEAAPHAQQIADLLSRYFTAINRKDYDAWLATVSTAQAKRDRDSWTVDYSTTLDSDVYISDIGRGDPMTVRMQFVSHQDIEFAPPDLPAECVRWDVTYEVVDEGVGLRVGLSVESPAMATC